MIDERNMELRSAYMVFKELSADEKTRLEAEQREKAWRDEMDRLYGAKEEGIKIGKEIGKEEGIQIATDMVTQQMNLMYLNNMYKNGLPFEEMTKYSGLDVETIKKILNLT